MLMNSRDGVDLEIFSPLDWSYVIRGLPCPAPVPFCVLRGPAFFLLRRVTLVDGPVVCVALVSTPTPRLLCIPLSHTVYTYTHARTSSYSLDCVTLPSRPPHLPSYPIDDHQPIPHLFPLSHTHTRTYTHTHIHTHIHTRVHTRTYIQRIRTGT